MDLIIFILVICIILYLFRSFNAFIYFMALAEILLQLLSFLSERLPFGEVTTWIRENVPSSIQSLINSYSSGILNTVLVWILVLLFVYFEWYLIRYWVKKKK